MKKIVIHKPGGYHRLKVEQHADPRPGAGEVRVAVKHAGVNYADCMIRMGLYESQKQLVGWPVTPGFEVAGRVDAVGPGVSDVTPGSLVLGVTLFNGYSSSVVLPRAQVFPIPNGLDTAQAAALPTVFLTAWFALHELAHVRRGEKVLVHSAAGGVGCAAVQLAAAAGCDVIGVVGAPNKVGLPRELGARAVFDKSHADVWRLVERVVPDGFDVVLDPNGVETLAASYAHLAPLGRLVVYGFHTMLPKGRGTPDWGRLLWSWWRTPRFDPLKLTTENRSVLAFNLSFLSRRTDLLIPAMRRILVGVAGGKLKCPPVRVFPFAEAAQAHRELESGRTVGKLVLEV